jgi:multidrug transporter EmrE-like cation transporter
MTLNYVALGISILAGIGGQMLLKVGADAPDLMSQLMRPSTIGGLALYGTAAFLYLVALRNIPVSIAFPSVSLSYAIVAMLAHLLFGEPFGVSQVAGIALIVSGVTLINLA